MKKRILALMLTAVLLINNVPVSVLAEQAPAVPAEISLEPGADSLEGAGAAVMPVDEPVVEPCPTCGVEGCTSEHLNWCDVCKKDDCGVDHTVVAEPCPTCGVEGCTSEHLNWCDVCEKDDCGVDHTLCESCGSNPCVCEVSIWDKIDDGEDVCLIGFLDKSAATIDFESEYADTLSVSAGECPDYLILHAAFSDLESGEVLLYAADSFDSVFYEDVLSTHEHVRAEAFSAVVSAEGLYATIGGTGDVLLYEAADASSAYISATELGIAGEYVVSAFSYDYSDADNWFFQLTPDSKWPAEAADYLWIHSGNVLSLSRTATVQPEIGCGCCEDCTGVENCDCGCVDCEFYVEPEVPNDPYPELPSVYNPENKVAVYAEELPAGTGLVVEDADVSEQLSDFGIPQENLVFALDISLTQGGSDYQPEGALVRIAVSQRAGTLIGILHTHGGKTTYIGTTKVLSDGTVEFFTDGFSEFAGFTVDFHYGGVDFSIDGMTSILLSELFEAMGIEEDAYDAKSVVFSDPTLVEVTEEGNDWRLTSLKAFQTEESLVITFSDDHVTVIDVTDAQTAQYDYNASTRYKVPGSGDYITIWIDKDILPADILIRGESTTWSIDSDGCDPNKNHGSISNTVASKDNTITIKDSAPVGYKFAVRDTLRGRAIVRVVEFVTFRYQQGNISTTPTKWPTNSPGNKIGTWSIADTTANTTGRTNTFTISGTTPEAPGYTFKNWSYTDWQGKTQTVSAGGSVRLDGSSITNNDYVDFTANWEANSYTYNIVYKSNTGVELGTETVTKKFDTTNTITPPAYTGYTTPAVQRIKWDSTSAKTITFTYVPVSYTIDYNLDGGTVATANPTSYNIETATFKLNNPTKTGYTFAGWTGSNGTTKQTSVSIAKGSTGNKAYTANWTANTNTAYMVRHWQQNIDAAATQNSTNYTLKETENKTGTTGQNTAAAKKTYTGFTAQSFSQKTIAGGGSTVVDIYYTRNERTVTYQYTGSVPSTASALPAQQTYDYGKEVTVAASPTTVANYTFEGWTVSGASVTNGKFSMPDNSVTITGNWTANTHTVTWKNWNGTVLETDNNVAHGMMPSYDGATPTKPGDAQYSYSFSGWSPAVAPVTTDVTYTAQFTQAQNKYTVTYDANGGTGTIDAQKKEAGKTLTLSNGTGFSKADYTLTSWNTKADGSGTTYALGGAYNTDADLTLYAQWVPKYVTYVVRHRLQPLNSENHADYLTVYTDDLFGGAGSEVTPGVKNYLGFESPAPQTVVLPTDGTNFVVDYYYNRKSYTVTLDAGTGIERVTGADSYLYEESVTVNATVLPGYEWDGWSGTNAPSEQEHSFEMPASNLEWTANAKTITYTIAYNLAGGSLADGVTNPGSYTVESSKFTLKNPTKTGYTFTGWTGTGLSGATQSVSIAQGSTGHRSYTANWTANNYIYNVVYKSSTGVDLGTSTVEGTFDQTYTVTPPQLPGYIAPAAQNVKWDSVEPKTITFVYTPITYTVQFNKNATAATGDMAPQSLTYDVETSLTTNAFVRTGYTFMGWAVDETGEQKYGDGTKVKNLTAEQGQVINLYAVWQRNTVNLLITTNQMAQTEAFDTNQNYLFDVEGWPVETDQNEAATIKLTVALEAKDKQLIVGLPAGTYKVTCRESWSWRYASKKQTVTCTIAGDTAECPFEFLKTEMKANKIYWLNGYSYNSKKTKGGGNQ